jgi:(p)ppGpp synthase/HD superfamily hydrolase
VRLEQAVDLARRFHAGQVDKGGRPYIEHVLRVMDAVDTDQEKLVAVMHDLLEDTPLTSSDLHCVGCPPQIVDGVEAMTKRAGEDYEDFIRRAAAHPIARGVKAADLADNANESRLVVLGPEMAARLRTKYASAQALL